MTEEASRRGRANKRRGKSIERAVAEKVGGQRIPDGMGYGDVQTIGEIIEVKSWQRPTPQWLLKAWAQALSAAAETDKSPEVVLSTIDKGRRRYWRITEL